MSFNELLFLLVAFVAMFAVATVGNFALNFYALLQRARSKTERDEIEKLQKDGIKFFNEFIKKQRSGDARQITMSADRFQEICLIADRNTFATECMNKIDDYTRDLTSIGALDPQINDILDCWREFKKQLFKSDIEGGIFDDTRRCFAACLFNPEPEGEHLCTNPEGVCPSQIKLPSGYKTGGAHEKKSE